MRDADERSAEPSTCAIQDGDRGETVMQVTIGEVADPAQWATTLAAEADDDPACSVTYADDPGDGYGCTHDSGLYVNGASVNVLQGDRLIRVTVYQWTDATPQERLALAEDVARNLEQNVVEFDAS